MSHVQARPPVPPRIARICALHSPKSTYTGVVLGRWWWNPHSMRLDEVDQDLPILLFFYDEVIEKLENSTRRQKQRFSRRAALEMFLATRSFPKTALAFNVTPTAINQIVHRAFRHARKLAGLKPIAKDEE